MTRKPKMDYTELERLLNLQYGEGNWLYVDFGWQEIGDASYEYLGYGPDLVQSDEGAQQRNANRLKKLGW